MGIDLGPHWGAILASYSLAVLVVGGLVGFVVLDHRSLRRTLSDLEARGVRRASGRTPPPAGGEGPA